LEPILLGRKTAFGGIMLVAVRLISRVFDFATVLVLARILTPADFGVVALATSLVALVEAALEIPLNQALLRLPEITWEHYDTAFTVSALRCAVIVIIVCGGAWPFAHFYGDPRLVPLVWVLCLGAVSRGLFNPRLAEFQKELSFWRDGTTELAGKMVGFVAGVTATLITGSYWGIVVGQVVYPVATVIISYILAPYRPRFGLVGAKMFSEFAGWMSAAQILSALTWQMERLLLGRLRGAALLGLFATAGDVANIPMAALFGPILRPLLAAFAHLGTDRQRRAASFQTASSAILTIGLPLLITESLLAEPIVLIILGERWRTAAPMLQWMALSLIPGLFAMASQPLAMAAGRTDLIFRRNLIEFAVKVPFVLLGLVLYGVWGVIAARVVSEIACAAYGMHVVRLLSDLPMRRQLAISRRPIAAVIFMAISIVAILAIIPRGNGPAIAVLQAVIAGGVGTLVYAAALIWLWQRAGRPPGIEAKACHAAKAGLARLRAGLDRPGRHPIATAAQNSD
jgi:PST family polysaccharide transporter